MSREEVSNLRSGQKNCHNCFYGNFHGGGDDFQCTLYGIKFYTTDVASGYVCGTYTEDKGWDEE